jgi:quercetin dioxygenase-like cupin family protein
LPNLPGKGVTIVRVFYGPGGFTRAHRHAGSVFVADEGAQLTTFIE